MKLALITGGSKGLGAALLRWHLAQGWEVREFSRSGSGAQHVDCDLAQPERSASILAAQFAQLAGRSWTELRLINNAGTLEPIGPLQASDPDRWASQLQINLGACVTATGLFLQHFANRPAARLVLNISSGAASTSYHGWSLYCASKAAIEAFTRCLALEQAHAEFPTTVVAIRPGVIETDMQALLRTQSPEQFEQVEKFRRLHAEHLLQSPDEAARKICAILAAAPESGAIYDVRDT
jgi:benzil reductase ((S)-benzoin forming)